VKKIFYFSFIIAVFVPHLGWTFTIPTASKTPSASAPPEYNVEDAIVRNCSARKPLVSDKCADGFQAQCANKIRCMDPDCVNLYNDTPAECNNAIDQAILSGNTDVAGTTSKKGERETNVEAQKQDPPKQEEKTQEQKKAEQPKTKIDEATGKVDGDPSDDVAACQSDTNSAQSPCDTSQANQFQNQVVRTSTGSPGQLNGADQINNVVTACQSAQSNCSSTCSSALSKWQNQCNGASCSSRITKGISQLQSIKSTCDGLANNAARLQTAGNQALNNAAQQQQQQQNGMNPSSTGNGNNNNNQPQAVASPNSNVDCTNPVNAV